MSICIKPLFAYIAITLIATALSCSDKKMGAQPFEKAQPEGLPGLEISDNHRYFMSENKTPFFWLGDTGWLLFGKLNREEAEVYLESRRQQGFNVIQVMVLHSLTYVNVYGDSALVNSDVAQPLVTPGSSFADAQAYDFWDHVDFIVDKAAEKGIYMALVPVWGTNVMEGGVSAEAARAYAGFLAERIKGRSNIIWLNGGDTYGDRHPEVWEALGTRLKAVGPDKLMSFHPRGRLQSSDWFHNEGWLDFNMFQSGHKRYDQDNTERGYGEDNWRFVQADYNRLPVKPTLDGEPSYEGIPQGLDDSQPFWEAQDVRRYAYWSVFAGAAGHTYGHNAIMQMFKGDQEAGYFSNRMLWRDALGAPGAGQMQYLKKLVLAYPYFERRPDQSLIANQGEKYSYLAACRGAAFAFIYTYTGREITVNMGKISGEKVEASWYNPRTGEKTPIGVFENSGARTFNPEGEEADGNDWVLILADVH
ncbi:MAG: glycoside hydrolase family 140 protein [Lewinellaceae bacterium]|nr:glycoside hydrolase family 140 protein [Lewinellaceae bacterium]